jgi:hypothetical protein
MVQEADWAGPGGCAHVVLDSKKVHVANVRVDEMQGPPKPRQHATWITQRARWCGRARTSVSGSVPQARRIVDKVFPVAACSNAAAPARYKPTKVRRLPVDPVLDHGRAGRKLCRSLSGLHCSFSGQPQHIQYVNNWRKWIVFKERERQRVAMQLGWSRKLIAPKYEHCSV